MTKLTTYITAITLLIGLAISPGSIAADSSQLEVEFEHEPLFSEANFLPGSAVTRWVKITNLSDDPAQILVGADHTSGCLDEADCITQVLNLKIEGAPSSYESTLKDFLNFTTELGLLDHGETVTLNYTVTMDSQAGNEFQEQTTGFSLIVGLEGTEGTQTTNDTNPDTTTTTAGGGGSSFAPPAEPELNIGQPTVLSTDSQSGGAELSWSTNQPAYGWIIYGPANDDPYLLDKGQPNHFGYPQATTPSSVKTTSHTAGLTNLEPGLTYYYRLVAQASPYTISREYSLTIPVSDPVELTFAVAGFEITPSDEPPAAPPEEPTETNDEPADNDIPEDETEPRDPITLEPDDQSLTASLLGAVGNRINTWLVLPLFLGLFCLLLILYRRRRSDTTV